VARAGLTPERVVSEAEAIVDLVGLDRLTLSELAVRLGVRQPSLYNHIESLQGLHRHIAINAKRELAGVLASAAVGKSGADAVVAIATAYRRWALEHPGRYATTVRAPAPDDADDSAASAAATEVVFAVLAGFGVGSGDRVVGVVGGVGGVGVGVGGDADALVHATRALRAALHGFVDLEARGGFALPVDLDESFGRLVAGLVAGLVTGLGAEPRSS
jgi:AcrR family transcriptional regulator